jgi:putative transposase
MNQNLPIPVTGSTPVSSSSFKIRIDATTGVHIDDIDYVRHRKTDDGYLLRRLDMPEIVEEFTFDELSSLLETERLTVTHNYHSSKSATGRLNSGGDYLSDLPDNRQTKWSDRLEIVEDFLRAEAAGKYSRSDNSLRTFMKDWFARKVESATGRFGQSLEVKSPPSPTAIRRWVRKFEACDHDPASLIDGYGRSGNRDARLQPEAAARMGEWVEKYQSNLKPSMKSLYREMRADFQTNARGLSIPSRNTFERAIKRLDPFHVLAARDGEAVARKKLYAVRDRVDVTRPLQRVEMDEQLIPLQTMMIERGVWDTLPDKLKAGISHDRYWCSKIIDVYSRVVLGFVITPAPSAASALATLKMALEDKTSLAVALGCKSPWDMFGLPELIVTDSGRNFTSKAFRAAVLDLGCSIMIAPAGMPQMRGTVERSFRTDTQLFYSRFPGRTFQDVVEKGEYQPEENIVVSIMELARLMVRYFVDIYHNTPHSGLAGDTPLNRWRTGVEQFGVLPAPPFDVRRHILSTVVQCRIGNLGVRVAGLRYQSKALQEARRTFRDKPVLVRVDTDDLGHISVKTESGWITVPCSTTGFDGISLDHWRQSQADLRQKHASVAALSEEIVARALIETREQIDALRIESKVPSPIMSSEDFVKIDRDLARGFDMVRPEDGRVGSLPGDIETGPTAVEEDDVDDRVKLVPAVAPTTFFME